MRVAERRLSDACRIGALCAAILIAGAVPDFSLTDLHAQSRQRLGGADRGQIQILSRLVDSVSNGRISPPGDVGLFWMNRVLKAPDNLVYIPYTITLDGEFQSSAVALYVRAIRRGSLNGGYDQSKMTMGAWRNLTERAGPATADLRDLRAAQPKDPFAFEDAMIIRGPVTDSVSRALWLEPGEYDVIVAMQEQQRNGKTSMLLQHLTIPDLSTEFAISSVMLVDQANPGSDDFSQADAPLAVSGLSIAPRMTAVFTPDQTLDVVFWIYNEALGADGKPNVEVDYAFYRMVGASEVFFNRTQPKFFTGETVPPDFDLSAGHQIMADQSVPLGSFPNGDYRLDIGVLDKVSGHFIQQDVHFSVWD
ncbi:MAG: hypothetical protein AB7P22_13720 [Vicinamibacterales bacterium]